MQVAKWGNRLVVRMPADVAHVLGIKAGDDVTLHALGWGELAVITEQERRETASAGLRAMADQFPADCTFDREEAKAR